MKKEKKIIVGASIGGVALVACAILLTLMGDSKGLGHKETVEKYDNVSFKWNEDTDCYYVVANNKRYDVSQAETMIVYSPNNYYGGALFEITKYKAFITNNSSESYKFTIVNRYYA